MVRRACAQCAAAEERERRTGVSQPLCPECEEERAAAGATLRRRADGSAGAPPSAASGRGAADASAVSSTPSGDAAGAVRGVVGAGGGRALDAGTRAFFEAGFGRDLGGVRVHTGAAADASARAVHALAYTVGHHVVFRAGAFAPQTGEGKRLLAHELAHVVQQGDGARLARVASSPLALGAADAPEERAADAAAGAVLSGQRAATLAPSLSAAPVLRRAMLNQPVTDFQPDPKAAKACVVHIHGEERTALAVAKEVRKRRCVNLVHLDTTKRTVDFEVSVGGKVHQCIGDPNRIFTGSGFASDTTRACHLKSDAARTSTLGDAAVAIAAQKELRAFANGPFGAAIGQCRGGSGAPPLAGPLPVVGLHNNEGLTLAKFEKVAEKGARLPEDPDKPGKKMKNPQTGRGPNESDFFLTTQPGDFTALRGHRNVVLQANPVPAAGDDGSLSVALKDARYINVEKEGRRNDKEADATAGGKFPFRKHDDIFVRDYDMAAEALDLVGAPDGPCVRPGRKIVVIPDSTMEDILEELGQGPQKLSTDAGVLERDPVPSPAPRGCHVFSGQGGIDARRDTWKTRLGRMPMLEILNWIAGVQAPPASATAEVAAQQACLVAALRAGMAKAKLSLPGAAGASLAKSELRTPLDQDTIWQRKFAFTGDPFDQVSPFAQKKCGLPAAGVKWDPGNPDHRKCWKDPDPAKRLTDDEKQQEILMASSAPGISRHHWGTDFDIGLSSNDLSPEVWTGTGRFAGAYRWLARNASTYGFIQPYNSRGGYGKGYMAERWHWSYAPIAQALFEFARDHQGEMEEVLHRMWTKKAAIRPEFSFIAKKWRDYMFNVETEGRF